MNVFGIGIDVVEVGRISSSIDEFGDRFVNRIFTIREREYCRLKARPELHFAARFAAKEAVAKALGTGIGKDVSWLDLEVERGGNGEPRIVISGKAAEFCRLHHVEEIKISLTHARDYAAANAIVLCRPQGL
ncbi:MAG: holo-ACP synthase [Verrucomicrobiota bacterium]|jgi:holo-[acyl-carrier protein] synthase